MELLVRILREFWGGVVLRYGCWMVGNRIGESWDSGDYVFFESLGGNGKENLFVCGLCCGKISRMLVG